jgi:hypothetical protein
VTYMTGGGGGGGGGAFAPVAAYVGLVTGYTYTGGQVVAFDTVASDAHSLWDATNHWFKVNAAGLWLVTCQLGGASNAGSEILINGTAAITYEAPGARQDAKGAVLALALNDELTFVCGTSQNPLNGSNIGTAPYGFVCYACIARVA